MIKDMLKYNKDVIIQLVIMWIMVLVISLLFNFGWLLMLLSLGASAVGTILGTLIGRYYVNRK